MRYARLAVLAVGIGVSFVAFAQKPDKTGANVTAGKELFHQNCSVCHGVDAKGYRSTGSGSVYDPNSGDAWRRVPPGDLTVLSEHNLGHFPAERVRDSVDSKGSIIAHGTSEMPAWGHVFDNMKSDQKRHEQSVRELTAYIESIQEPTK
jgi:mono/diheme cytochrome c family protein